MMTRRLWMMLATAVFAVLACIAWLAAQLPAAGPVPHTAVAAPAPPAHIAPAASFTGTLPLRAAVYTTTVAAPLRECDVPDEAIDLIIAYEVGSPSVYRKKYRAAVWPGAASGATIGIGYDLGHRPPNLIIFDWAREPHRARLATASGITGPLAKAVVRDLADILIEYNHALDVFELTSVVEHCRIARRVFGPTQWDRANRYVRGALLSVVFNRGGSMAGQGRAELRHIRDVCLPAQNWLCVADQIEASARIWAGSAIANGMHNRRVAEGWLIRANV